MRVTRGLVVIALLIGSISAAHAAQKILQVGLVSNFSEVSHSSANPFNNSFRNGVGLALKDYEFQLKAKNLKIQLKEFDYGTSSLRVLKATQDVIASDAIAAIGYNFSSYALIAAPLHENSGLAMITPSATADRLGTFSSYVHSICLNNSAMAKGLVRLAVSKWNPKNVGAIVAADCAYCEDLADSFSKELKSKSGTSVEVFRVLEGDSDFTQAVSWAKKKKAQVLLIPNQEHTSARLILALAKEGIKSVFLGGDGWGDRGNEFIAVLKSDPAPAHFNGYSVSHWHYSHSDPKSRQFTRDYTQLYHQLPQDTSVLAYDSMSLLLEAILKTTDHSRKGIEDSLRSVKKFVGVTGTARYDQAGVPTKDLVLLKTVQESNQNYYFKWVEDIAHDTKSSPQ